MEYLFLFKVKHETQTPPQKILHMLQHMAKGFCGALEEIKLCVRPISGVEIQCNFAGNGFHCQDVTHSECVLSAHGTFCLLSWLESSSPQTALGSKRQTMDDCACCGLSRYLRESSYVGRKCFNCQLWTVVFCPLTPCLFSSWTYFTHLIVELCETQVLLDYYALRQCTSPQSHC